MKVVTGVEDRNGCFACSLCGESQQGESALQVLERIVKAYYDKPVKQRIVEKYSILGSETNPTEWLPAVFVGKRGFFISTQWNPNKREHELA